MISLSALHTLFVGSKTAKFITVCVGALVAMFGWSKYQQHIGGNKREAKIIKNTIKAGRNKNAKSSKARRRIKPSNAGNSLWNKYGSN